MPSIIKSFRVIQTEPSHNSNNSNHIEDEIKIKLIDEANLECEKIITEARTESQRIIDDSERQSELMIESAYERSKVIFNDSKDNGYNEGYKTGHEEGYELGLSQGYDKGYNEGKIISEGLIKEALEIKNQYINKKDSLLKELEADIVELVMSIYEKIINDKIQEESDTIIDLVLNGIQNLDITDKLTIIVAKEDFDILEMSKDIILAKASMISELVIRYDISFKKGDCILETSKGNIDVSIQNQLDEVRELLTTILNNE
ncbi:FliH/SctL family protein [Tissierella sp.]|uniref:FliH/SctL family protein n=1 Tax=Tissierella sp. TaxID=41274 RepID=UPI002858D28C|nr:FliH/SctL family protein [Tissierella sp.]MDR7856272.1 FliH/SctL family protein [Tissierella sp.]